MSNSRYSLGLDFGTESARALLVDVATGREVATAVYRYGDSVIDEALPGSGVRLGHDWALQNPANYIETLKTTVPEVLRLGGVRAEDVIGIGVDFTACTLVPVAEDGQPLCLDEKWRGHPHAWPKLWKHHAAYRQAERITAVAEERGEEWLAQFGGRISSEWLHSKALQMLDEAPDLFDATARFVEAGDWVVWAMTGSTLRNVTAASCKGLWRKGNGYPESEFLRAIDPRLEALNGSKLSGDVVPAGTRAGGLTEEAAEWMGLLPGTAVSVATIDAHAAVPGAGVTGPGCMVLILGTSTCHMMVDTRRVLVPGISGVTDDSIIPGLFGYEAGQAAVGDIFEWFVEHGVPAEYSRMAAERNVDIYQLLEEEAAKLQPGESGLVALDWWNGNRSLLVDAGLSGMIVGMTLGTRAPEIYRALIEATAFGTKIIIDAFEERGIAVQELVAAGGLAERNKLLVQIYADVTGREFRVAGSSQCSALGAAMFGTVAAGRTDGGYDTIADAAQQMAPSGTATYHPDPRRHEIYRRLFDEYRILHDYFGRGGNDVMKRLRELRMGAL
jgi:L-ribulokinase